MRTPTSWPRNGEQFIAEGSDCHEALMWYVHHLPKSMKTQREFTPRSRESKADPLLHAGSQSSPLQRRAATQRPIIERGLTQISRAGNPKRPHPNCQAGPTASSTPLGPSRRPDAVGWAPLVGQAR